MTNVYKSSRVAVATKKNNSVAKKVFGEVRPGLRECFCFSTESELGFSSRSERAEFN